MGKIPSLGTTVTGGVTLKQAKAKGQAAGGEWGCRRCDTNHRVQVALNWSADV